MRRNRFLGVVWVVATGLIALVGSTLHADTISGTLPGGEIGWYSQGGSLPNDGAYNWWYGCSPTSAGMVMGYYDRNGYQGQQYSNLVPGGVAEANTFGTGPYLVNDVIASAGHIADFYAGGYLSSGDDHPLSHTFNCLADFMGTSQDSATNVNGSTTFYYWTNGAPFTAADVLNYGLAGKDGMYGIGQYLAHVGYGYTSLFTQLIASANAPLGFTFAQYEAEIDAGRPMIIQVAGHSMFGYGYDTNGNIILHDTWDDLSHTMAWGGSYAGMAQWGVVGLTLGNGDPAAVVPEPTGLVVMSSGGVLLLAVRCLRRRRAA